MKHFARLLLFALSFVGVSTQAQTTDDGLISYRGEYSSTRLYTRGDQVHTADSFLCNSRHSNNQNKNPSANPDDWDCVPLGGATASTGSTGGSPTGAAGGDLQGTYPNPTVKTIGNVTPGNIISHSASEFLGATAAAGGDLSGAYPNPNVVKINGQTPGNIITHNASEFDAVNAASTALTQAKAYTDAHAGSAVSGVSRGQVVYQASNWTATNATTFASPGGVTLQATNGGSAFSLSNGKIEVSGDTGNSTDQLFVMVPMDDEDVDVEVVVTATGADSAYTGSGSTAWGLGVGFQGINSYTTSNVFGYLATHSTPAFIQFMQPTSVTVDNQLGGQVSVGTYPANPATNLAANTGGQQIYGGHQYRIIMSRRRNVLTFIVQDLASLYQNSISASTNLYGGNFIGLPNSYLPAISDFGGPFEIDSIKVISREPANADVCVLGDSKSVGYNAIGWPLRYASLLAPLGTVAVYAGSGDRTVELVQDVPHIIANGCKHALVNIGRNDLAAGVPTATWQANYSSIISQLKAASIPVTHLLPIPETSQDQTALKSYITSTFTGDQMVDVSNGWNSAWTNVDNIHPTAPGHSFIASQVLGSGFFTVHNASSQATTAGPYPSLVDYPQP